MTTAMLEAAMLEAAMLESPGRLLSPPDAAAYLATTPGTLKVYRSTKAHRIPYVKIGTAVRYRLKDLDRWIAKHRVT